MTPTDGSHTRLRPATTPASPTVSGRPGGALTPTSASRRARPAGPEAGNLANLRAAAAGKGTFTGDFQFQDSDVQWLEAASWQLSMTARTDKEP